MIRWRKRIRKNIYILLDIVAVLFSYYIATNIYTSYFNLPMRMSAFEQIGFVVISYILFVAIFLAFGYYEEAMQSNKFLKPMEAVKLILSGVTVSLIIGALIFYTKLPVDRKLSLTYMLTFFLLSVGIKTFLKIDNMSATRNTRYQRNIVVIGQSTKGISYIHEIMKHQYLDYKIIGYISINTPREYDGIPHLGTLDEVEAIAKKYVIDEFTVVRPLRYDERLKELLDQCQIMGITVNMLLDYETPNTLMRAHVAMVGPLPALKFHMVSLNETQLILKRVIDVLGALVGMALFGIAIIFVGPLIKLESKGPMIFKQDRVGKNGRVFKIWKFRSMGVNAEAQKAALMDKNEMTGNMFKMTNDPRVTKIGAFIRKTSIDEIPQFYNVLKGDMSLVGTRPPTVKEVEQYDLHHHCRIATLPGITGMWQISGRSEIEDFEEIVRLDREYIANWSVWLDIKILLKTVWVVIARRGSK